MLRDKDLVGEESLVERGGAAEERGRQGDVCVPADAMLTASFSGEEGSNLPGLPPAAFAAEASSCWLMLLCCCWRKSRTLCKRVTVTPPPPLPDPTGGLGAIGTGRVGVPLPPWSLMGVFLEPPGEKSWRRAELGEAKCSRKKEAIGEGSPELHKIHVCIVYTLHIIHVHHVYMCSHT